MGKMARNSCISMLLSASLIATATAATAQDASQVDARAGDDQQEARSSGGFSGEILVTATRRTSSVQDVGVSVSAYSGEQLRSAGITTSQEIVQITPGLQNPQSNSGFSSSYAIRGVTQSDFGSSQEAPVALYLDDVYQANQGGAAFQLFDTERVEVLRGPQGTLFGRNATGGLVHFITRKPDSFAGGYLDATYGRFDRFRLEGAVNAPLSDKVAVRVSAVYDVHDTFVENRTGPDVWDRDELGGRIQFAFDLGDNADLILSGRFGRRDATGVPYDHAVATPTGIGGTGVFDTTPGATDFLGFTEPDDDPFTVAIDPVSRNEAKTWGATATLTWDFGNVTLTSITDVTDLAVEFTEDSDMQPGEFFHFDARTDNQQLSQELRLAGDMEGSRWTVGAYYLNIDGDFRQDGLITDLGFGVDFQRALYSLDTESYSLFAQSEFDLTERLTFTGGVRWVRDEKEQIYENFFGIDGFPDKIPFGASGSPNLIAFQGADGQSLWSVRAQFDYDVNDDVLLYASYNRGVKGFGFNAPLDPSGSDLFIDPLTFDPAVNADANFRFDDETLHAFELGVKANLGGVRFSVAAFYYDYNNYQALNLEGITQIITNNDARMYGLDAELFASPWEGADIMLGASWLDNKVEDVNVGGIILDREVAYAPEWDLTGLVRQEFEIEGAGTVALQANGSYVSNQWLGLSNAEVLREDGYFLGNARASFTFEGSGITLAAFVNNFTDTRYRTLAFDLAGFFGSVENQFGRPREWGVMAQVQF